LVVKHLDVIITIVLLVRLVLEAEEEVLEELVKTE
jgi:hypothetical protein